MSSHTRAYLVGLPALLVTAGFALGFCAPPAKPDAATVGPSVMAYRVSVPLVHENLTIFFLLGQDQIKGKQILTLDEALKTKKVIVHETKNVNELAIENVSAEEVFAQAGDIVKGGQQDRTIALDVLIHPKSGRVPVGSFCVEQGRWSKRGGEDTRAFNDNRYVITGNSLKIAARREKSQGGVWKEVGEQQDKLGKALKEDVKNPVSQSSLQLTLENKKLQEVVEAYQKKFASGIPEGAAGNAIGFAVAINGKVMSADVYANADLFRRLWPKLLRSTVIEAVGEKNDKLKIEPVQQEAVSSFLADAARGKRSERNILDGRLKEVQCETAKQVLFETKTPAGAVLRQSYIAK